MECWRTACEDDPLDVGFVGEFVAAEVEECQFYLSVDCNGFVQH